MVRAGIQDICLVVRPEQAHQYATVFGNGCALDCDLTLRFQDAPNGIVGAIKVAKRWAGHSNIFVLLGDSIFGHNFGPEVEAFDKTDPSHRYKHGTWATIYAAHEPDPHWCAQIEWRQEGMGRVIEDIHEKPKDVVSHDVVPGCYIYDYSLWDYIDKLVPSHRGELEITDLNRSYLKDGRLQAVPYQGLWIDAGTDMNAYIAAQMVEGLP